MFYKVVVFVFVYSIADIANGDSLSARYNQYPQTPRVYYDYGNGASNNEQNQDHHQQFTIGDVSPYTSRPIYSSRIQSQDDQNAQPTTGQEAWNPSIGWNGTNTRKPSGYVHHRDADTNQQHYIRSPQTYSYKKTFIPGSYYKHKRFSEKPKQKPHYFYYTNTYGSKKIYPRIYTPYNIQHKYSIKKPINPYYRRHYNYINPRTHNFRTKPNTHYMDGTTTTIATPTGTTDRFYNTDDRQNHPATSEDYPNYNNTYPIRPYDEMDRTTAEPISYNESVGGYYDRRKYMGYQPFSRGNEKGARHRYYVYRNAPEMDDEDDGNVFYD